MKPKGQWMSLDFLLAMILITLSIGVLLQFSEVKSYSLKEKAIDLELQRVTETAANLLVSSPDIVCELVDVRPDETGEYTKILAYINNCLTVCADNGSGACSKTPPKGVAHGWWKKFGRNFSKGIYKEYLGLGDEFACSIEISSFPSGNTFYTDCQDNPSNAKNVFSIKRKIILTNTPDVPYILKQDFVNCIKGSTACNLMESEVTLKVWRKHE